MTEKRHKLGETIEVKEGAPVVRPDGTEGVVTGGAYVLDERGTFVIDGTEVTVK